MSKLIAAINMTLDRFCDHTTVIADDDLHRHYNELFRNAGTVLFGRITYQLMESAWPPLVAAPYPGDNVVFSYVNNQFLVIKGIHPQEGEYIVSLFSFT